MKLPEETQVKELLLKLGATPNYTGFHYLVKAILMCVEEEFLLLSVTKTLYPEAAKLFSVTPSAYERNIRTVIQVIWHRNNALLNEISGYRLLKQPTVSQFLSIIVEHLIVSAEIFY